MQYQACSYVAFDKQASNADSQKSGGEGFDGKGYPDAANTGVPSNVTLIDSTTLTISTAGTVIENLNITGNLVVAADNVTIKNSKITASSGAVVRIANGTRGTLIQDCEIDGEELSDVGLSGAGTFLRNHIHSASVLMAVTANSLIEDNFIHNASGPGSSFDGIRADYGYSNLIVRHNTIINEKSTNAALMLDAYNGPTTGALIENNRLIGGNYTIYAHSSTYGMSGVTIRSNRLGKGVWGYMNIQGNTPIWTGNVDDITNVTVP